MVPEFPSCLTASVAMIERLGKRTWSSLMIVPVAVGWVMPVLLLAPERVTVKASLGSTTVSPLMEIVMTLEVSPGLKTSDPKVRTFPEKSLASAGLAPEPETA